MKKNASILLVVLIFVLSVVSLSFWQFRTPEVLLSTVEQDQFSSERAMHYLENIAVKPRPSRSEQHALVRDYLVKTLTDIGLSPEIQKVTTFETGWNSVYEGEIQNIVARIRGENSSNAVMISSHYDSVPNSPGAGDAGSAVAAILETTRALMQSQPLKNDVIILITDEEENGFFGAEAFVQSHPWAKDVGVVFNFDARGNSGPSILFETSGMNGKLISEFIKAAPNPVAHSMLSDLYKLVPLGTDFSPFKYAGMQGLNFAFIEGVEFYHSSNDTIENLSISSVQHHGDYMLHLVRHFGNLNIVGNEEENKVFFNLIGKKVVKYSENLVIPIMIVSLILFAFSIIHGYKSKKLTAKGVSVGFVLFFFTIGVAFAIGTSLSKLFISRYSESNLIILASILILYALIAFIYQAVSKKVNQINLTIGANFVWLLFTIGFSLFSKASSYFFVWPLICNLIGINILMHLKNETSIKRYVISFGFSIPGILITAPIVYLVFAIFTLEAFGALLALSSLLYVFILPIFCRGSVSSSFRDVKELKISKWKSKSL